MTKEQAELGPLYEFLGPVHDDGTVAYRHIGSGRIEIGIAEFVRLANVDWKYGERSRYAGEYGP